MTQDGKALEVPPRRRRKDDRPGEIIEAALALFVVNGFAATKLSDVAQRAGVVKGTLYRYFDTKESLFRAVVQHLQVENLEVVRQAGLQETGPFAQVLTTMLARIAQTVSESKIPAIVRMVLAESRSFPDLSSIWHDEIVAPMLGAMTSMIASAQARGELGPGDPRLHAMSIMGPMLMGILYQEVFRSSTNDWLDLESLARQHTATILKGMKSDL
ncbi:TetR family transcriptional regulator [Massilia dura]|uniref:TetR family transcriptional regulator n=1 Tax=Pseudoduganella dura TaxID=321982 RepID=A0A6I3XF14_9BURK|nr:TetR/AcrR family transcriptional regulator [Pseudoduganella dura]MUI11328.1 TetR family transcriptional regulator [Pseudoduganella dura]GGX95405.1 TetR family transcriptional regulator [Pseudoduganella dura]